MMGAGMSMGGMMTQSMADGGGQPAPFDGQPAAVPQTAAPKQAEPTDKCNNCGAEFSAGKTFFPDCGQKMTPAGGLTCANCGAALSPGAKFCPECGTKVEMVRRCPQCNAVVPAGTTFCPECGQKL